jgi:hypothetical protein
VEVVPGRRDNGTRTPTYRALSPDHRNATAPGAREPTAWESGAVEGISGTHDGRADGKHIPPTRPSHQPADDARQQPPAIPPPPKPGPWIAWPVTRVKYGKVAVLLLPSAARTAAQSVLIVVMSAEVMFEDVMAAASAS